MVSQAVIGFVLLPAVLFILLLVLVLISDTLHYGIDFCSRSSCGPGTYFLLQLLSTLVQVIAIPVYLLLITLELILNFILSVMQTLSMLITVLLGYPLGLAVLLLTLGGCLYFDSIPTPLGDEGG
ncbi:unnamed protein product [Candidula unifasciata]|uniref:Uncharacterized protein n=1 Tax=Candidula unifasciata TaxID=100452 RepID=A0A8S4A6B0_9EUPU|nr:unnamed protein product [Candidula unifasciata]